MSLSTARGSALLALVLLLSPAAALAQRGGGERDGGDRGGPRGGGGVMSGIAGGFGAVMNGGEFQEGYQAGRSEGGGVGEAFAAGRVVAAGGPGGPVRRQAGDPRTALQNPAIEPEFSQEPYETGSQSPSSAGDPPILRRGPPPWSQSPALAAAEFAEATVGDLTAQELPEMQDPTMRPVIKERGPEYYLEGGKPAPVSPLASLDTPKRYQTLVPKLPPGREYKGGYATAAEMANHSKLGLDAVASLRGVVVDAGRLAAPASGPHPEGARRLASGGRVDNSDRARALRATLSSGESRLGLKDYKGALSEAESAMELAPRSPHGYMLNAKTLNSMGMHAKAETEALKSLEFAGDFATRTRALMELTKARLFQGRVVDAMASADEAIALAHKVGNDGLEANAYYLKAAACQLKGDRDCMVKSLERAARLDPKYSSALEAARAGKNIFDPNDSESLGLLDAVSGDAVPAPGGMGVLGGAVVALFAALAGAAGWMWRRSRRAPAPKPTLAETFAVRDDGLLGGKYELGRAVPSGGRGEMWEAKDVTLGRGCQVLRLESPAAAEDARRLAFLHHPAVVDVFEVLDTPTGSYMVVEHIKGRTLRQVLTSRGKLPVDEARRLLKPVCEALELARAQGADCGGLDLGSVVLSDDGFVKILDLSTARAVEIGRTDVQALAACFAELVTGEAPRPGAAPALGQAEASLLREAATGTIRSPAAFASRLDALTGGGVPVG
ncbi:MAG: hypothetical protein HYZ75_01690 [Elusimicrobia bacterium]|nr:hypothetical protein [Elusimicrobiota bacterium]